MINYDYFIRVINKAAILLNGHCLTNEQEKVVYEQIKDQDHNDFRRAINSLIITGHKLTYAILRDQMLLFYEDRLRREEIINSRKIAKAMSLEKGKRSCTGGLCSACPVQICDAVSATSAHAIKQILQDATKVHEIKQELAGKFRGLGFADGAKTGNIYRFERKTANQK